MVFQILRTITHIMNRYTKGSFQSNQSLGTMNTSKRSLKNKKSKNQFHYLNATGPGDYNAVNLTGLSVHESNKKNAP